MTNLEALVIAYSRGKRKARTMREIRIICEAEQVLMQEAERLMSEGERKAEEAA